MRRTPLDHHQYSILPLNRVNLLTGKSKYFNVYDTWGENTTYEIYEVINSRLPMHLASKKTYKIVATSGKSPLGKLGELRSFKHDQTWSSLFSGRLVDYAVGSELKKKAEVYGKSLAGYTYK